MKIDYIIVGQGIAGTLLARELLQKGKKVALVDNAHAQSSSMLAAGTVNPITGRRYVKTWLCDTLIPHAKQYYRKLEQALGIQIFHDKNIAFVFSSVVMQNDWLLRPVETQSEYVAAAPILTPYQETLKDVVGVVEFSGGGKVDMPLLLQTYKKIFEKSSLYKIENFDYQELKYIDSATILYKDWEAKHIIFCEGAQAATRNPYFNYLPFNLAKGEILLVRIPNYPLEQCVVKHRQLFIAPWAADLYWVGSSYIRDFQDEKPTEKERDYLLEQLALILQIPFELVEHRAGIRPTVRDRRPFIGQHPTYSNYFIFNGFGAKGSYSVPYFAEHFLAHLLDQQPLMREVDIARF